MSKTYLNFEYADWQIKDYGTPCAITMIDIIRPNGRNGQLRWSYSIMIEIISGKGSGGATCAIISNPPQKIVEHDLVEVGVTVIHTAMGDYIVNFCENFGRKDYDNLTLTKVN